MRSSAKLLSVVLSLVSSMAFAQQQGTTYSQQTAAPVNHDRGLEVAIDYVNMNNQDVSISGTAMGQSISQSSTHSTSNAEAKGFSLTYKDIPSGVGYELGATYLVANDDGGNRMNMYQLLGNFDYSMTSNIYGLIGANFSYLDYSQKSSGTMSMSTTPGLGGQIGLGFKASGFNVELAYMLITQTVKMSDDTFQMNATANMTAAGVNAKVGYIF